MTVRPSIADCGLRIADWRAALAVLIVFCMGASALGAESDALRRKQQAQEKARALAGELVAGVLDIQLRQLEENGLKDLSIYKDIASMKGQVHELMKGEMEEVVRLLVLAQEGAQKDHLENFNLDR